MRSVADHLCARQHRSMESDAVADSLPLAGCRVLVIEDEYFIADELNRALVQRGAEVVGPVGNLEAAMIQVEQGGFEVAVVDLNLRDEMAYAVADELSRQAIPFVLATGYDRSTIPVRFADVKRWEKPFDERQLVAEVQRLCSAARAS